MTVRKRKKNIRQRGSKSHGWGSKKKHRGAGSRGGRGRAGRGKRACQKMPSAYAQGDFLGKRGFVRHGLKKKVKAVNLGFFKENKDKLMTQGLMVKEDDFYVVEARKLGFNKVLGGGRVDFKLRIKAESFSQKAEEKIKKMGGEVIK